MFPSSTFFFFFFIFFLFIFFYINFSYERRFNAACGMNSLIIPRSCFIEMERFCARQPIEINCAFFLLRRVFVKMRLRAKRGVNMK
jgi:hypothetical protein